MSASDEMDVPAEVISAGPTPGQKLRQAREMRGLSLDDVTAETNLAPKYLKALEEDDYAALPGLAFARGYARRYAQLVHLDGSALIADIDALAASRGIVVTASLTPVTPATRHQPGLAQVAERKSSELPAGVTRTLANLQQISIAQVLSIGSLGLLILLLLGTLFWQGGGDVSSEPVSDSGVIDIDAEIAQPQEVAPSVATPPAPEMPVMPEPVPPQDPALAGAPLPVDPAAPAAASLPPVPAATPAPAMAAPATTQPTQAVVPAPAPVASLPTSRAALPAAPAPAAVAPATTVRPGVAPAPTAAPAPVPAPPAAPVAMPKSPAAPAPASAAPGIDSLNFSFSGKSWISVRDATGQELVYGLKNAGQVVTVTGQAPFSINIGNVNVTSLSRNGRGVNLKQYARGEIASFRLAPAAAPKP